MKKVVLIIFILSFIIIFGIQYYISKKIDTKYAIKYSDVFGSYDINKVDQYLNDGTLITYKGVTKTYNELWDNVVIAFEDKKYEMKKGGLYGHGDDHLNQ